MSADPIRSSLVTEGPRANPQLSFPRYARILAKAALDVRPATFTFALYGPWGRGKSTLLHAIRRSLLEIDDSVPVVYFDAWRYQRSGQLIAPLLSVISNHIDTYDKSSEKMRWFGRKLREVVTSVDLQFLGVGVSGRPQIAPQYLDPFASLRSVSSTVDGERIVILIDDLDRCSPDAVAAMIEAIHVLTDIEGLVFFLALDRDQLIGAIKQVYALNDHEAARFLEKIVNLEFVIPTEITGVDIEDLVRELAGDAGVGDLENFKLVARLALRSNPRQVARLINSLWLATEVLEVDRADETRLTILVALLGLRMGWNDKYRELEKSCLSSRIAVLDSMKEFVDKGSDIEEVGDYYGSVLGKVVELGELAESVTMQFISLASTVAPVEPTASETADGGGVGSRRPRSTKLIYDHKLLEAGAPLYAYFDGKIAPAKVEAVKAWAANNPDGLTAVWENREDGKLRWLYDGSYGSPTALAYSICRLAYGESPTISGGDVWADKDGDTLYVLALGYE